MVDFSRKIEILDAILKKRLVRRIDTYNFLISNLCHHGKRADATSVFENTRKKSLELDFKTQDSLVRAVSNICHAFHLSKLLNQLLSLQD